MFLKALRALRNAELPDTRPTAWFSGAKRLANQSFDRQIFLHNRTLRVHYAAKICPSIRHFATLIGHIDTALVSEE
jgi:hypothetical protein